MTLPSMFSLRWESRERHCYFTREDLVEFDALLRAKFPDLHLTEMSRDYKTKKVYASLAEVDRAVNVYRDATPRSIRVKAFIDGYEHEDKERGVSWSLRIRPAEIKETDLSKAIRQHYKEGEPGYLPPSELPRPINFIGRSFKYGAEMSASHPRGDAEEKRFHAAVFRMSTKLLTNVHDNYDLETGKYIGRTKGAFVWTGKEGTRLSHDDPDFYAHIGFDRDLNTWVGLIPIPRDDWGFA